MDNFLLFSNGVRPHSFSALMLFVNETALVVIFEDLYWIKSIFSFAVGSADAQMGAAYSSMDLIVELLVVNRVHGFDPQKAPQSLLRMFSFLVLYLKCDEVLQES